MSAVASSPLVDVQRELAEFNDDPLGFVLCAYPWGQGELQGEPGPRAHQRKFLTELRDHLSNPATRHQPFRKAVSSGHGIGKSTVLAWITHWGLSTFEDTKVIVMAGTGTQLETKTQPECAKWFRLAANTEMFEVNVTAIKVRESGHDTTWRCDFNTWSEQNPQASAGAHNKGKRLIIAYDEAATIPDGIWQMQEGAFTDEGTELIWIAFSQCMRSDGMFYEVTQASQRDRWRAEIIDSREVEGINIAEINAAIAEYGGEESDFARVRYRGLYPLAGEGKFIDLQLANDAQKRAVTVASDEPLIAGVDFAWGGSDDNVVRFRRGLDARSIPPVKVKGVHTKDPAVMRDKLAQILTRSYNGQKVAVMFVDNSGVGGNAGAILAGLRSLGHTNAIGVNFGDQALDQKFYALRRDEMWGKMREWLREGAIDSDIELASDLQKPMLMGDREQRIKLEPKDVMKKRLAKMGLDSASPDDADALALTFAMKIPPQQKKHSNPPPRVGTWS
jgi:hypothetical protein